MRRLALAALASTLAAACVPDGQPEMYTNLVRGQIGGACDTVADCRAGNICFTNTFEGASAGAPGGYCSHECNLDADCAPGRCISGYDGKRYCEAFCDGPSRCRLGYVCSAADRGCEPVSVFVLDCDPKAPIGFCSNANVVSGGCVRRALGDGMAGECLVACGPGQRCPQAMFGCHEDNETARGDNWNGMLCSFAPNGTAPVGGSCAGSFQCVSGADCTDTGICVQRCDNTVGCPAGFTCEPVTPPQPTGACF